MGHQYPCSSPEAALLMKNHNLWPGHVQKSPIHGLPVALRMLRVKSDESDWFWSQSIVFTEPFRAGISLNVSRGRILGAGLWGRE